MPAIRGSNSKSKTRRRKRDIDQVFEDLHSEKHLAQYKDTKAPEDLPALGEFYCVECAKWFEAEHNLVQHRKGKPHKRRLRLLKEAPYTQKEADAAVGLFTDNGRAEKMVVDKSEELPDAPQAAAPGGDDNDEEVYDAFFKAY